MSNFVHLIIGIGNPFRRDDGVGVKVAERIAALGIPGVRVETASGEGASIMEMWQGCSSVVVVDAIRSGSRPGQIHRMDAQKRRVPTELFHYSSHAFGLAEAIETARALNEMPTSLLVFGIEGKDFSEGTGLTEEVSGSVDQVVRDIARVIDGRTL